MPDTTTDAPELPTFPRTQTGVPLPAEPSRTPIPLTDDTDDATQEAVSIEMLQRFHAAVEYARRFVAANASRMPASFVEAFGAWATGYGQLVGRASADTEALRTLFGRLSVLRAELETYRRYMVHYVGQRPPAPSPLAVHPDTGHGGRGPMTTVLVAGAGLGVGLLAGLFLGRQR